MAYVEIPKEIDFSTVFPTWIIAYCPDTDSWFCTNRRFFYYEYSREFHCESDAIEYFRNNIDEFASIGRSLHSIRGTSNVFLENTGERWTQNIDMTQTTKYSEPEWDNPWEE